MSFLGALGVLAVYATIAFVFFSFFAFLSCGGEAWLDKIFGVHSGPWNNYDKRPGPPDREPLEYPSYWNSSYRYTPPKTDIQVGGETLTDEEWHERYVGKG